MNGFTKEQDRHYKEMVQKLNDARERYEKAVGEWFPLGMIEEEPEILIEMLENCIREKKTATEMGYMPDYSDPNIKY